MAKAVPNIPSVRITNTCLSGHTGFVTSVRFAPDDHHVATSSWDKTIKLWSGESDKTTELWPKEKIECSATLNGHDARVNEISFSPDGKRLASCDSVANIREWDVATQKTIREFKGNNENVTSVSYSSSGDILASGGREGIIYLWDTKNNECVFKLTEHDDWVNRVSFSPSSKRLISASSDCTAKIWDVQSGKSLATLQHKTWVRSARFSPNGKHVATCCISGKVYIWDAQLGTLIEQIDAHTNRVNDISFAPSGTMLTSCSQNQSVKVFDVSWMMEEGADKTKSTTCLYHIRTHTDVIDGITFSSDGKRLASCGWDCIAQVWNVADCDPRTE